MARAGQRSVSKQANKRKPQRLLLRLHLPDITCPDTARCGSSKTMISQAAPISARKIPSLAATKEEMVLTTDQLVKIYGGRAVVDGIDMHVRAGEIVGLLGPNGAGKTTSFYMIVGLVRPNSGHVIFCDTDVTEFA